MDNLSRWSAKCELAEHVEKIIPTVPVMQRSRMLNDKINQYTIKQQFKLVGGWREKADLIVYSVDEKGTTKELGSVPYTGTQ